MKKIFYYVSALLLAGALSWSCSDDDNDGGDGGNGKGGIVLDKGTQTEQVVYANDKSGKNEGIKFTAQGPWKAEVKEVSTKADAEAAPTVDWLALSQYSGDKAGDYTITLTLKQNFTGKTRKAEICIICGDTVITITIEQKAEKSEVSDIYPNEEPYELWEHYYEVHVGNELMYPGNPDRGYKYEIKNERKPVKLRSEKNTYTYTVVYE